jgi:uncharacterized YceG family protein
MSEPDLDFLRQLSRQQQGGPPAPARRNRGRRRRKSRKSRVFAPLFALVFLGVVIVGGGYFGYTKLRAAMSTPDYVGTGTGQVTVQIRDGDPVAIMGDRLVQAQVVKSVKAFLKAANQNAAQASAIQPGFYQMHIHMSGVSAFALLLNPKSRAGTTIIIPEGLRQNETLAALSKKTGIPLKEFQAAAKKPASIGLPAYAHGHVEGYLYPGRYDLNPNGTATDLLKSMVDRFKQQNTDLTTGAAQVHLSPSQVVVMASLIQAEGGTPSDYPKIARVLFNRIANNDYLKLDTTVLYAENRRTLRVYNKDLQINSPYNTYIVKGLPFASIDSPGQPAIQAALNPASGNWYYFVTTDPDKKITKFTNSNAQFAQFQKELYANLKREGH